MSQTPRHINTSRSLNRPDPAAAAPRHAASSTDAKQSTGGARNEPPRRPAQGSGQNEPPRRRNKKKKTPLWLPFAVVMAIIAVISGVVVYGVSLVNKVEDSIRPDDSTPTIEEEVKTAEEYKGDVVNILVCGIDYEEGRNYSNDPTSNDGMTDMILYVQFDIKNGALRMLQIPRNSLVTTKNKKITLSNGKTYAATNYQINSVAISNGGSIAALADVIYDQFRLPIDYYVTVDMQALVDMVDNFGGIEVYIPHDMSYGGSKLLKGYRKGYLSEEYLKAGVKAYNGILKQFIKVNADKTISLTRCCAVSGLGPGPGPYVKKPNYKRDGSFEYYMSEPIRDNDAKGVGPFIWASLEMEQQGLIK